MSWRGQYKKVFLETLVTIWPVRILAEKRPNLRGVLAAHVVVISL